MKPKDITGQRFNRLTALSLVPNAKYTTWLCRCDCGTVKPVLRGMLISRDAQSCGCLRNELTRKRNTTHGCRPFNPSKGKFTAEYGAWTNAKYRCHYPKNRAYKNWGGRGIYMCDRWRNSFSAFLEDMGPRPSPEYSIDRIDNDGPYSPDNCRWATRLQQAHNQRPRRYPESRMLTFDGKTMTGAGWARHLGLSSSAIYRRLKRGLPIERVLSKHQRP